MLTQKSLIDRSTRFRELRKMQMQFKSLCRARYARRMFSKKINDDLVIEKLCYHAADFLECSFSSQVQYDIDVEKAKIRMIRALRLMASACAKSGRDNKKIPLVIIRVFRSAVTNLYRVSKHKKVFWECDSQWTQMGLCAHIIFD